MLQLPTLSPDTLQFVLLSFEGPDQYAMAGGLGVRMRELALELARKSFDTHLIFVGDPDEPNRSALGERLTLHRWCQWLSHYYREGVYSGEEAKLADWNASLPGFVVSDLVRPASEAGKATAIMAEEWHTAHSTCLISDQLWAAGLRDSAAILWNANNIMGFDRIDWPRLGYCSQITTVSRYMKHIMWGHGVNPLVIPNGIPEARIRRPNSSLVTRLRDAVGSRELLFKIGRWSPDKRWNMAVEALAQERDRGHDVTMVMRGGIEPHALEVIHNAQRLGLRVVDVRLPQDLRASIETLAALPRGDIYNIQNFMCDELISLFYAGADAVLANSGHEPFGLVGLEVMATGGIAFVGATGEDYAVPWLNAVVIDSDDPTEISIALQYLRDHPEVRDRMRREARATAKSFSWATVIEDGLLSKLKYVTLRQDVQVPSGAIAAPIRRPEDTGAGVAYGGGVAGPQPIRPRESSSGQRPPHTDTIPTDDPA